MDKRNHHGDPVSEATLRRAKRFYAVWKEPPAEPCPTLADIREAYSHVRESRQAQLGLGEMLLLLEEYEGRSATIDEDFYRRPPGLRKFFSADPFLASHYKSLMRYKALAKTKYQPKEQ